MAWVTGELDLLSGSDRFSLGPPGNRRELHCGDRLAIWLDERWQSGRVEFGTRLGWYWTNDKIDRRLLAGDQVRTWEGLDRPRLGGSRDDRGR
jgi:hypothetical protein